MCKLTERQERIIWSLALLSKDIENLKKQEPDLNLEDMIVSYQILKKELFNEIPEFKSWCRNRGLEVLSEVDDLCASYNTINYDHNDDIPFK